MLQHSQLHSRLILGISRILNVFKQVGGGGVAGFRKLEGGINLKWGREFFRRGGLFQLKKINKQINK